MFKSEAICTNCIHEKVCSKKDSYNTLKDRVASCDTDSTDIFVLSVVCREFRQKLSGCIR